MRSLAFTACLVLAPGPAPADPARVEAVEFRERGGTWTVSVTIRHGDTGWDDYADGWRVEAPDGTVLGTRVLHHPHVEEQPFTRSLGDVTMPPDLDEVTIRTRTSVTGWADAAFGPVPLPRGE
jgi:hypothetical protein